MTSLRRLNVELKQLDDKYKYDIKMYDDNSLLTLYCKYGPINFCINKNYPFRPPTVNIYSKLIDYNNKLYNETYNFLLSKTNHDITELIISMTDKNIDIKFFLYTIYKNNEWLIDYSNFILKWSPQYKIIDFINKYNQLDNMKFIS